MVNALAPLAAVITLATGAVAWGASGHQAVGYVAQEFLAPKARHFVEKTLGATYNYSLGPAAIWADQIKSQASYKWSSELHYVDAEDEPFEGQCSVSQARDCPTGRCILSAIANYTSRVTQKHLDEEQRGEALKFITHFLGDIGQPLHVEAYAIGGNGVNVTCGGNATNLHATWDTGILETSLAASYKKSVTTYASALVKRIKKGDYTHARKSWIKCSSTTKHAPTFANIATLDVDGGARLPTTREEIAAAIQARGELAHGESHHDHDHETTEIRPLKCPLVWAAESNALDCTVVFTYQNGTDLCKGSYYETAVPLIDLQIAKQGYRLAAWLNVLFDGKTHL